MKKKTKIILFALVIVFIIVILNGITISVGSFFFTTKYYASPQDAYHNFNNNMIPLSPPRMPVKDIGIQRLDGDTCLYLAQTEDGRFVVLPLQVKNGKYACRGIEVYYEADFVGDIRAYEVVDGIRYVLLKEQAQVDSAREQIQSYQKYTISEDLTVYLVILK